jgi:hypothetical protein
MWRLRSPAHCSRRDDRAISISRSRGETGMTGRLKKPVVRKSRAGHPHAGQRTLRRAHAFRSAVSIAVSEWKKALPHAWRCSGIGRADEEPERPEARPIYKTRSRRAQTASRIAALIAKDAADYQVIRTTMHVSWLRQSPWFVLDATPVGGVAERVLCFKSERGRAENRQRPVACWTRVTRHNATHLFQSLLT